MKLKEYSEIRTGLVLSRKQSKDKTDFYYKQITLRSVTKEEILDTTLLDDYYAIESLDEKYLSQCNDIIVKLIMPYTAVIIDSTTAGYIIPSQFVIIRCNEEKVPSQFLYWYLNSEIVKKEILRNNTTNALGAIRPGFIGELEIRDLSLNHQELIMKLNVLMKKEQEILQNLQKEKMKLSKIILEKLYIEN